MLHVSTLCDHYRAFKILKCVSTSVVGLLVYNGHIVDNPILHNLFEDYNIVKCIGLIIKLGKSIIFPLL
jgi:hypothetical protein